MSQNGPGTFDSPSTPLGHVSGSTTAGLAAVHGLNCKPFQPPQRQSPHPAFPSRSSKPTLDSEHRSLFTYSTSGRVSKSKSVKRAYSCQTCGRSFARVEHLRRHAKIHEENILRCRYPECHKEFYRADLFQRHLHETHKLPIYATKPIPDHAYVGGSSSTAASINDLEPLLHGEGDEALGLLEPYYPVPSNQQSSPSQWQLDETNISNLYYMEEEFEYTLGGNGLLPPIEVEYGRHGEDLGIQRNIQLAPILQKTVYPSDSQSIRDSARQSGVYDDSKPICSLNSDGSSLGLPRNFIEEFISVLGNALISGAGVSSWAYYALEKHSPQTINERLCSILDDYSINIQEAQDINFNRCNEKGMEKGTTQMIRRYRRQISRYFQENTLLGSKSRSLESRLPDLGSQLNAMEKFSLWTVPNPSYPGETELAPEDESSDNGMEEDPLEFNISTVIRSLFEGPVFMKLATAIRRELYSDDFAAMKRIRQTIVQSMDAMNPAYCTSCALIDSRNGENNSCFRQCGPHTLHKTAFTLDWAPLDFMDANYGKEIPDIGKLITLSGSALYAYCVTCSDYMQETWPGLGAAILPLLQNLFETAAQRVSNPNQIKVDKIRVSDCVAEDLVLSFELHGEGPLSVVSYGSPDCLVDLGQQLAWLSAVMASPYSHVPATVFGSKTNFVVKATADAGAIKPEDMAPHFMISQDFVSLQEAEQPCWLPLFENASIAYGFPAPMRFGEMGLEISITLLAALVGASHAVEYGGGIVMKGYSTLLVPTKIVDDTVHWHLVTSENSESRLTYKDAMGMCKSRLLLGQLGFDALHSTRAVVGWCSSAETVLGSKDVKYENIHYSGTEEATSDFKLTGGTLGVQNMGVAQLDVVIGSKEGRFHIQRSGTFRNIILAAEKTPVTLYDTQDRRAWLVSASEVLTHIVQHRHFLDPYIVGNGPVSFRQGSSARETLLGNATLSLSEDEPYLYRDMVMSCWSVLEYLIDQKVCQDRKPGTSLHATLRDRLFGFEYKAIVEERSPFRQKRCTLAKSNGGWLNLVQDIDALILFGKGFGDVIRHHPKDDSTTNVCSIWTSVPLGKDYLATTVHTLNDLYDVAGHDKRQYLTSTKLCWHRSKSTLLFEPCQNPQSFQCSCDRLQQIFPEASLGRLIPPGELQKNGAVIFGTPGSLKLTIPGNSITCIKDTFARYKPKSLKRSLTYIYSKSNGSIEIEDATSTPEITPEKVSASESEYSAIFDSEETHQLTEVSSITSYASLSCVSPELNDLILPEKGECQTSTARSYKRLRLDDSQLTSA